ERMPKIPVDIGIMEQADERIVVPVDYGWSDVGGWRALYDISEKDAEGNVLENDGIVIKSNNCYAISNREKLITLIGVNNLVIVDTDDALLVADKNNSEKVKEIVNQLKNTKRNQYL
ncbi:MAG: mannose-1-phosphate guanylyltransferase/mannose-6-phosphate isomerase, partial [Candidatus Cloacimonetes bacterium]|nr:mannose-1-phosphate guanylyltransferase/mannose-6-phosphate isomerase [Candidatus Cloacimonadota bacterium]